jgi:hypothetical protein
LADSIWVIAQFHDSVAYVKAKDAELAKSSGGRKIPGSNQTRKLKTMAKRLQHQGYNPEGFSSLF